MKKKSRIKKVENENADAGHHENVVGTKGGRKFFEVGVPGRATVEGADEAFVADPGFERDGVAAHGGLRVAARTFN